ncbi:MAG: hypothetical protein AAGD28_07295 [Bacteroidota bacterium]
MIRNFTFVFLLTSFFFTCNLYAQDPIPGGCGTVGPNMVVNPEFDDGNTGFTNSFNFNAGYTCSFGDYTIASTVINDPAVTCYSAPGFNLQTIWKVTDRINGSSPTYTPGNFMIVDPCDTIGTSCSTNDLSGIIWEQTLDVCPNNTYTFSVFVKNIYTQEAINYPGSDTLPDFELTINGDTVSGYYVDGVLSSDGSFQLPKMPQADSAVWFQISGAWESGTATSANLVMKNLVPGAQGNDLALDGIFFGLCGKEVGVAVNGTTCQDDANPTAIVLDPDPATQSAGWLYYEWFRDGVLMQGDANGTYAPSLDPVDGYKGEYVMIAYEDPAGATCGHSSEPLNVVSSTSPECQGVFPVEMLSFDGKQIGQSVELKWATAQEINNQGFEVQISQDGVDFEKIGFVNGMGNSSAVSLYTFQTGALNSGSYIFRLRQIDYDGSFSYSDNLELSVDLNNAYLVSIAPNPINANSKLLVEVQEKQEVRVDLLSTDGKLVERVGSGLIENGQPFELELGGGDLPGGLYLLRVQGWNFSHFEKIIITR